jgi:hypothetical protein
MSPRRGVNHGVTILTTKGSFLQSFIKRIEVNDSWVKMYYTIPVLPDNVTYILA